MFSFGIDASLALRMARSSGGLPSGSPPPSRAATVIARVSLENCAPRRESTIAFLCLMLAHLECPDMRASLRTGAQSSTAERSTGARHHVIGCARMSSSPPPDIFKAYDIRGIYGEQIDGGLAERIGRAFARVLSQLAGKPVSELSVGLGRDMRLSAPELAARYREGLLGAGAHVIDAGEVGSEMLYYLVGSRGLDGGLMRTASHNPKAYTGAKLVREGAIPLSGDAGIQDIRRAIEADTGDPRAAGEDGAARGSAEEVDIYAEFQAAALRFIDPQIVRSRSGGALKVVLDGGNGMAGPMVGPVLEQLGLELIETYWTPDGSFPDHEPNPLLAREPRADHRARALERRRSGDRVGRRRDRCFFIDERGAFVDGRLPHRAAGRLAAAQAP